MSERVVTVRGLVKSYGDRRVVDGLDLDVGPGEIVGLIGANGAGKTTAVECVQGLRRPDAGTIQVLGYDPTTQVEALRQVVGSQLQESALPDRLRVAEAVSLFATPRATGADELVERFGLGSRRRTAFASLSGGERQRLFLVLALLNRPRLVILDELTQGLDPAARRDVWAAVAQLHEAGTTVLLVTHELDEAEALCDRVVALRAGRVIDQGSPRELVDRHGRWSTVTFSVPHTKCPDLGRVTGVESCTVEHGRVVVRGDRRMIAHVGAALVADGPVPGDLRVDIPSLDDALVRLLDSTADSTLGTTVAASPEPHRELEGATR